MEIKIKLIAALILFIIGIVMLVVVFVHPALIVTGTLVLQPHPPTGEYVPLMKVWTLESQGKTYYLLDSQQRLLGSSENHVFVEGGTRIISGYTITFESYDGNQSYTGFVIKEIAGHSWS